jgi:hypothetical protein
MNLCTLITILLALQSRASETVCHDPPKGGLPISEELLILVSMHSSGKSVRFSIGAFRQCSLQLAEHCKNISVTVQEHFIAYCRYREAVKVI